MNRLLLIPLSLSLLLTGCSSDPTTPNPGDPDAGVIDPNPTALVACVDNGFTELWAVNNLHGEINIQALSNNGILAVASLDGSLKQWVVGMSAEDAPLPEGKPSYGTTFVDEGDRLDAMAFANGAELLIGGDVSGNIKVWNTGDSTPVSTTAVSKAGIVALSIAPNETDVVIADTAFGGNMQVWNRTSDTTGDPLTSDLWSVSALAFNSGGDGFVAAGEWYGVYSLEHFAAAGTTPAHRWTTEDTSQTGTFKAIAFSADGSYVAAAGDDYVMVFDSSDFSTGPIAELKVEGADFGSVILAGGFFATTGGDGMLRLLDFDADAGTLVAAGTHAVTQPVGLSLDASSKRLLAAGADGRVRAVGCVE